MRRQAGVILLGIEGWLSIHLSERKMLAPYINSLWEYGKNIFEESEKSFLDECCKIAEKSVESNSALDWKNLIDNMKQDYEIGRARSYINTLVQEISEVA